MPSPVTINARIPRALRTSRQYRDALDRIAILRLSLARMTRFDDLPGLDRVRFAALVDERMAELDALQTRVQQYEQTSAGSSVVASAREEM
jgi:hypothetical protein